MRQFRDRGYDATSLQDIADEIGLTKSAVFYHFRGKQEILRELAEPVRRDLTELMARASAATTPEERVESMIAGWVEYLITWRDVMRITAQQPALRADVQSIICNDEIFRVVTECLFGPNPTPDQSFAVYTTAALPQGIWALGDMPEDQMRALLERALRRIAAVR